MTTHEQISHNFLQSQHIRFKLRYDIQLNLIYDLLIQVSELGQHFKQRQEQQQDL